MLSLLCHLTVACSPADVRADMPTGEQPVAAEAQPTGPPAENPASDEPTVIVDKAYIILRSGDDKEVGTLTIRAVETEQGLLVTGEMALPFDYMIRLVTSVAYDDLGWTQPVSGRTETFVDAASFMAGTVEFGESAYSYAGVQLLDDRTVEVLVTPVEFGQANLPRPAGPIVVLQDFPVVAPRLLPEGAWAGGLIVTIVDFAASVSAGELMTIEHGGVLVRDYPDEKGNVKFSLLGPSYTNVTGPDGVNKREPQLDLLSTVTYDANGEIVDYFVHRSWRLVEADDAETPEEGDE